jgi:hypothetical protein
LVLKNSYSARQAAGVAVNIGQRLLYRTKDRDLHIGRKALHVFWHIEGCRNPASLCEAFDIPMKSRRKTNLIEQGRM